MFVSLVFVSLSCLFFLFIYHFRRRRGEISGHGPPVYPVLGCLIAFYKNRRRLLGWYTELLAQSPTQTIVIRRLGARRTIITANPDNVEYILKTKFDNYPKGKPFTEVLGDLLGRGIFNVDGELWHTQRKLASHGFSAKSLREFVMNVLEFEMNERLLPILESACADGSVVELQELLRRFTFDTICKVSMGTDPSCLDASMPVSSLARAFEVSSAISARRGVSPLSAVWKAKRALRIGSERQLREAVKHVRSSVMEIIHDKKKLKQEGSSNDQVVEQSKDLLSRLILGGHDEEVIRDMIISIIMAGRDTTSAALTWLFWLLSRHPNIEREAIHELSTSSSPMEERQLDYDKLKNMKVLKACLCESMRLYPPVAWDSKHAITGDILPDGTRVDKGDRVTYFPYGMGRMETLWGEDCMKFNPKRWLETNQSVSPYKFPVFQGGPRICLGKEMAFIQMKYVVATILPRFELRPVSQNQPLFIPLLTAHMEGGLKVMVSKRNLQP